MKTKSSVKEIQSIVENRVASFGGSVTIEVSARWTETLEPAQVRAKVTHPSGKVDYCEYDLLDSVEYNRQKCDERISKFLKTIEKHEKV